jgi:hypothetical protein
MSTNQGLKPWAIRPFELIHHAEIHYHKDSDYDRRLALISFDNSIEVSITTYLSLNPIQRSNREYRKEDVNKWLNNFHTKLDFFVLEIQNRRLPEYKEKADIVWYHDQRNEHYHGGGSGVPEKRTLDEIRQVALWIFSVLFETPDVESKLEASLSKSDEGLPSIPANFVVPREPKSAEDVIDPAQGKALSIAALLGRWDEGNEADREIIRRLADGL